MKNKLLLLVISFAICILLVEVLLSKCFPQPLEPVLYEYNSLLGYIPSPNKSGIVDVPGLYSYTFHNNSLGMREKNELHRLAKFDKRILALGDSQTYGIGVSDNETFSQRIEDFLRGKSLSSVEVINGGCGGKGTDYALKFFETYGSKIAPQIVILAFYGYNDFADNIKGEYFSLSKHGRLINSTPRRRIVKDLVTSFPLYESLISKSHIASLFRQTLTKLASANFFGKQFAQSLVEVNPRKDSSYPDIKSQTVTDKLVEVLANKVKQHKGQFIICYIPSSHEVRLYREQNKLFQVEKAFKKIIHEKSLEYHSLTPVLADSGIEINSLFFAEGHLTQEGHRLIAKYLQEVLLSGPRRIQ